LGLRFCVELGGGVSVVVKVSGGAKVLGGVDDLIVEFNDLTPG
jgi:hypothetical protein